MIKEYQLYLENCNLSENTVKSYLKIAAEHIEEHKFNLNIVSIRPIQNHLTHYIVARKPSARNSLIKSLNKFYTFVSAEYDQNFSTLIHTMRYKSIERIPGVQKVTEVSKLALYVKNTPCLDIMDKLIVLLIINHGVFNYELRNIRVCDLNFIDGLIRVSNDRLSSVLVLSEYEQKLLQLYLEERNQINNLDNLFICNNKPISSLYTTKLLNRLSASLGQRFTQQKLRNHFIVSCLNANIDEVWISSYLRIFSIKGILKLEFQTPKNINKTREIIDQMRVPKNKIIKIDNINYLPIPATSMENQKERNVTIS